MSCPQSRVGLGQGREVSGTARQNILATPHTKRSKNRSPGHPSHENRKLSTRGGWDARSVLSVSDREPRVSLSAKRGCIIKQAVGIAQLAEHRTVAPTVAGSIPVSHPRFSCLLNPYTSGAKSPQSFLPIRRSPGRPAPSSFSRTAQKKSP